MSHNIIPLNKTPYLLRAYPLAVAVILAIIRLKNKTVVRLMSPSSSVKAFLVVMLKKTTY